MDTVIYHNPRCSKSRETLALLRERGIAPVVINYLEEPLSGSQLSRLLKMLDLPPTALVRFKDVRAAELALQPADQRSAREWCELLAENPALLERPIVVNGKRAALGRPPENVLAIL